MRGADETSGSLFSYVDLEDRIPAQHPLRKIRQVVSDALASLDAEFEALYTAFGRPSIAPERLIRASLLQILFSIRSERPLLERCCTTSVPACVRAAGIGPHLVVGLAWQGNRHRDSRRALRW
uniref:transposase n=1 Tax=Paracoccus mutanolyticus TaxID=1499308 RepID=UPI0037C56344